MVRGNDAYRGIEVGLWPPDERMIGDDLRNLEPVVCAFLVNCLREKQPLGVGELFHRALGVRSQQNPETGPNHSHFLPKSKSSELDF